ncbi:glutamine--fructose-6-phosphate transaminase (isomerizing) [Bombilactobacillus thymidiniphilus]|uniref:Glutamine--fructose-6-phosphate aminotransferase [isomerizing] n=1 Tax=Bombilactobacillus thymidiniphilus TaxID=2923363 RepID=A0ABY4PDF0_9LACO|nr:glutamine--fructose-6-phosphate transaminase (isomerizing) [Bombilactobacillus thymidiniphilus]UQS83808.1 glutamine--fructose-6-phosphate transaminase (isomerizing) [Bombilactobacillus thymidiniphilus]
MCGIVGAVSGTDITNILINGLERLEYRGYDSAGVYITDGEHDTLIKKAGKIVNLKEAINDRQLGNSGIGHTRWATHGQPSEANAHPHFSQDHRFYLVHNGVLENTESLKETYLSNVSFASTTDTEVIVQLVDYFVCHEKLAVFVAFEKVLSLIKGSYAIALMDRQQPEQIMIAKNKSPLLIGVGDKANFIASDAAAVLEQTHTFMAIADGERGVITKDKIQLFDAQDQKVNHKTYEVKLDSSDLSLGAYDSYMSKEIDEQPAVLRRILKHYFPDQQLKINNQLLQQIAASDRIYIVAAGTSWHAGLVGKQLFEDLTDIPVEVQLASEFGYHLPKLSAKPFFIFLSQSGETADSRQVLVELKKLHKLTLTITNVENSTLAREADYSLALKAGPEIAVASTKAYIAQIAVEAILAKAVGENLHLTTAQSFDVQQQLSLAASAIQTLIDKKDLIEQLAATYFDNQESAFFIGRGNGYYLALEASLKLKEVSYVHSEGFAAGELKHGTIALIEQDTPVIGFVVEEKTAELTRGNIQEAASRGANTLIISTEKLQQKQDQLVIADLDEHILPIAAIVPAQLLAYYVAKKRGNNVDQPRNLAKSVTVE